MVRLDPEAISFKQFEGDDHDCDDNYDYDNNNYDHDDDDDDKVFGQTGGLLVGSKAIQSNLEMIRTAPLFQMPAKSVFSPKTNTCLF